MKRQFDYFTFLAVIISALVTACSNQAPPEGMMKICNENGCSYQPTSSQTYNPSAEFPDPDPDGRIAALEDVARQDPRAAYDLGLRFFRGDGVRKDTYLALKWMRDAAERGNLDAQKAVGRFYLTGLEEMGSDPREAERWLSLAAQRGDKESAKLLKEATEAKQSEAYYNRRINDWRQAFFGYWNGGYPYRFFWRGRRWFPY